MYGHNIMLEPLIILRLFSFMLSLQLGWMLRSLIINGACLVLLPLVLLPLFAFLLLVQLILPDLLIVLVIIVNLGPLDLVLLDGPVLLRVQLQLPLVLLSSLVAY